MKFDTMFLVVRLNNEVVEVVGIGDDIYTNCQIKLKSDNLIDDDIRTFYSSMSNDYINERIKELRDKGYILEEQEAKDLTCKLSQYVISIEHKEIEII